MVNGASIQMKDVDIIIDMILYFFQRFSYAMALGAGLYVLKASNLEYWLVLVPVILLAEWRALLYKPKKDETTTLPESE